MISALYAVLPVIALSKCTVDVHHPENGGYYIEGIAGVLNAQRDKTIGRRADNTTWAKKTYYPHGEVKLCTGQFCSEKARTEGETQYVVAHTCALLRFSYAKDSKSTVYEMQDLHAFTTCDFTNAYLWGKEDAGDPHYDYTIEDDHEKKEYYFASKEGCTDGQKVAVTVVDDYVNNAKQCANMGKGSSRIQNCDCDHQLKGTTLIDPCHTAFANACMADMPDDKSCCPDPSKVSYDSKTRKYVNGGTCVAKSLKDTMLKDAAATRSLCETDKKKCEEYEKIDKCPPKYDKKNYDARCNTIKAVKKCHDATGDIEKECQTDLLWLMYQKGESAPEGESAGSCYSMDTHKVTCNVPKDKCGEHWYEPGYVSSKNKCCHCKASCKDVSDKCSYYDAPAKDDGGKGKDDHGKHDHGKDDHAGHDHGKDGDKKGAAPGPTPKPSEAAAVDGGVSGCRGLQSTALLCAAAFAWSCLFAKQN